MRNRTRTRSTQAAVLAVVSTGLVGGAAAVIATPAHAIPVCNLDVVSVTAFELNDNDGRDEMKIRLGSNGPYEGPWNMWDDYTRSSSLGALHEAFVGTIDVGLYEQDPLARQTIDVDTVDCNTLGQQTLELDGNGAIYRAVVEITEL